MISPPLVAVIARHELRILLRSRWVTIYAGLFALLTFAVSYFGMSVVELAGFQELHRTAVSLVNLVLYIVPLATMLMAVQSFRAEGGTTEQLLAEPVTRSEIVLGKLTGLGIAHLLAIVFGFGVTGILAGTRVGIRGVGAYIALAGFTLLLGMVFLSLAAALTSLAKGGLRSYAVTLLVWFLLVLLFDLIIVGLAFVLPEWWANRLTLLGVFLNPVDATRVAALLTVAGRETFGPAGALLVRFFGSVPRAVALLVASLLGWILLSTAVAIRRLSRQDF